MLNTLNFRKMLFGLGCVLALVSASPAAQAEEGSPAFDAELLSMLRTAQLHDWLGASISWEQSLCIQDEFESAWPKSADVQLSERQHERLLQLREKCLKASSTNSLSTSLSATSPERGLVTSAKKDYLLRTVRLVKVHTLIQGCKAESSTAMATSQCLQNLAGRKLSAAETQQLLSLASAGAFVADEGRSSLPTEPRHGALAPAGPATHH